MAYDTFITGPWMAHFTWSFLIPNKHPQMDHVLQKQLLDSPLLLRVVLDPPCLCDYVWTDGHHLYFSSSHLFGFPLMCLFLIEPYVCLLVRRGLHSVQHALLSLRPLCLTPGLIRFFLDSDSDCILFTMSTFSLSSFGLSPSLKITNFIKAFGHLYFVYYLQHLFYLSLLI